MALSVAGVGAAPLIACQKFVLREIATCALQSPRPSPRLSQWCNAPPDCTFTKVKLLPLVMDRRSFLVAVVAVVAAVDAANRNKSRARQTPSAQT
jgi:hypothetical protein